MRSPRRGCYRRAVKRSLDVLTLNIWNRQGPWDQRLALIREGVEALSPDVIGLQEVLAMGAASQAHAIAEGLGYHVVFGTANELGGGVMFGNAVLSRWPILASETTRLPNGGSDENRSVVLARIASPWGELPFFSTHLNWRFHHGVVREEQVVALADIVLRLAPVGGLPPIVVGDFNAVAESAEIRFLTGLQSLEKKSTYFADCFGQTGVLPGITFDEKNPFAAPVREYPRRIDYVFVRGPDAKGRGKPLSSRVVFTEPRDGVTASDHYGVLATIAMGAPLSEAAS